MRYRISLLALACLLGCAATEIRAPSARSLPSVPLATLDGRQVDLRPFVAGRVSLVNLWASWCDACQEELAALNRLAALVEGTDAVVVGIAVGEKRQRVVEYLRQNPSSFVQLVDEDLKFADTLDRKRIPSTLVVDREGRIVFSGATLDGQALAAFRQAIAQASGRSVATLRGTSPP